MTDKNMKLTRRQILGATGAVGLAGAGAGLGTSAFFSDEETFENNTLTAGQFSLKVDWEEHYSYPQIYDGFDDPTSGLDNEVHREDPGNPAYVGFPYPEDPMVWIHEDDLNIYMRNTSIEAFPDPDDNGQQGDQENDDFEYVPCEDGAWLDEHLDPTEGDRTANADTENSAPLVDLEDVKPGDFGELTLSFHICDNPGYVWLQADNVEESENGLTDPEMADSDEDQTLNESDEIVPKDGEEVVGPELAENIQTAWWYDTDGNNVIDSTVGSVDVMIAVDTSDSIQEFGEESYEDLESAANTLAEDLDEQADAQVGGLTFADNVSDFTHLEDSPAEFSGLSASGGTAMPAALDIAAQELDNHGRDEAESVIVVFTDGGPNYTSSENRTYEAGGWSSDGLAGGSDWNTVEQGEMNETADIADSIHDNHTVLVVGIDADRAPEGRQGESGVPLLSTYLQDEIVSPDGNYYSQPEPGTIEDIIDAIIANIAVPEEVFHRGTLAGDLDELSTGDGVPLDANFGEADEEPYFDTVDGSVDCFQPGVNYYIGFAWWLPTDVGNEVQSDSVSFDLGFYAEQCRNNDEPTPIGET